MKRQIGVLGLWHLGCVITASWAKLGCEVVAIDFDEERIEKLSQGISPIYEPGLDEILKKGVENNSIQFSTEPSSLSSCDYIFIAHDTPVGDDDMPNISSVEDDFIKIIPHIKDGALVIVSAQLAVGVARRLRKHLKSENASLELVYSPENLRLGEAISCYTNPGHIVIGGDSEDAINSAAKLFSIIPCTMLKMNLPSAEMAKHGINTYLAVSVGLTNELANECERSGASIIDVVSVMRLDPRIGKSAYLTAGIGFSGGTLGRDLAVLDTKGSEVFKTPWIINGSRRGNNERLSYPSQRLIDELSGIDGANLALLGMTYKAGTSTLRRSLPIAIAIDLVKQGASIKVYDPRADWSEAPKIDNIQIFSDPYSCVIGVDAILLLTDWPEFLDLNFEKLKSQMRGNLIFDSKGQLSSRYDYLENIGFKVLAVGRGDLGSRSVGNGK
jgi:UDPglucose 6-dehydrogenase